MEALIAMAEKKLTINRNAYLKQGYTVDNRVFYIESGAIRAFIVNDDGEDQNIRFGYKGNLIVALDSFFTGKPSPLYLQALKKTVVKVITKTQIDIFVQQENNWKWWVHLLESLVVQQLEREVDLLTPSPRKRFERVLERSPQVFQEIPHRHIANYLRMSAETLSRLQKS